MGNFCPLYNNLLLCCECAVDLFPGGVSQNSMPQLKTLEQLDKELEEYMASTPALLDKQLDDYMAQNGLAMDFD